MGGELSGAGSVGEIKVISTQSTIYLNGQKIDIEAYNINGNNYFKLRDLGQAIDFGVAWDTAANAIRINTVEGY